MPIKYDETDDSDLHTLLLKHAHELEKNVALYWPVSRERALALTKLEEFALWMREAPKRG